MAGWHRKKDYARESPKRSPGFCAARRKRRASPGAPDFGRASKPLDREYAPPEQFHDRYSNEGRRDPPSAVKIFAADADADFSALLSNAATNKARRAHRQTL